MADLLVGKNGYYKGLKVIKFIDSGDRRTDYLGALRN